MEYQEWEFRLVITQNHNHKIMENIFSYIINILLVILLADFFAGIVHWWEDAYGNPNWKYLGKSVIIPNIEHHQFPRKFLKSNFFERIKISVFIAFILSGILYMFNMLNYTLFFSLFLASLGNEFHAMTHKTDKENGKIIVFLKKIGLVQSTKMHGLHHKSPYNINYCVMTNYLNPVLNIIRFWIIIEFCLKLFGINNSRNNPIRNGY